MTYRLLALLGFDLLLLGSLGWFLRLQAPLDRRVLAPVIFGMLGFVFQAFLCFSGAILIVQLGMIAGSIGLFLFWSSPAEKT